MLPSEVFQKVKDRAAFEDPNVNVDFGFVAIHRNTNQGQTYPGNRIVVRPSESFSQYADAILSDPFCKAYQAIDVYDFYCFGVDYQNRGSAYDCDRAVAISGIVFRAIMQMNQAQVKFIGAKWSGEPRDNFTGHQLVVSFSIPRTVDAVVVSDGVTSLPGQADYSTGIINEIHGAVAGTAVQVVATIEEVRVGDL